MPGSICPLLTLANKGLRQGTDVEVRCLTTECAWYVLGSESGRCSIQAVALGLFGISKKLENKNAQQRPAR
jgi:hypothetical protein